MSTILYEERSQTSPSGKRTVLFFAGMILLGAVYTTYKSTAQGVPFIYEYAVEIIALYVLIKQAVSRFQYILTEDALIIKEQGIFRKSELVIPYDSINGICPYTREFFRRIKLRYKYRKISSLDRRDIWELIYSINGKKSVKHAKVRIKADDAFFDILETKIPGKVKVTLDDVVFTAMLRVEAHQQGHTLQEYVAMIEKEREAEKEEEAKKEAEAKKEREAEKGTDE